MVLSAEDIHKKKFNTKMRGYNIDEVNDFLDQVTKDYQILKDENERLNEQLKETNVALKNYDNHKEALNSSILVAQEAADNVRKQANRDAEEMIAVAQTKANELIENATSEANQAVSEGAKQAAALAISTNDYRAQLKSFRQKMIGMLESQLDFAKDSAWTELIDGVDYKKLDEIKFSVESLDNVAGLSVNSESNQALPKGIEKSSYVKPTVLILPTGEVRTLY
ncbi:DivIVA domain-containing protein [Fructilactobacillus frigidiflavus]|uniref:DivIVA domain-containing protein n=1 Tax=Fructilactobacillus frigidiflavus TaxID=3242688 RepID=UPI0037572FB8